MCNDCSRRVFLKGGGLGLLSLGIGGANPLFLERAAAAAVGPDPLGRRKVLVTIFQRGAMDGIAAVPPMDERSLKKLRPRLFMSAARSARGGRLIDLNGEFGLHPAFEPLHRLWGEERLAIVHSVGSPDSTRSHFDAQDYMETGTPGRKGTASGWLNRVSGLLGHEPTPFRNVSMTAALPRSFYGDEPAIAVTDLADFRVKLPGASGAARAAGQGFEALYEETSQDLLRKSGGETFEALDLLSKANLSSYRPARGAEYPDSPLGQSLRQIAQLIKSEVGPRGRFRRDRRLGHPCAAGDRQRQLRQPGPRPVALDRRLLDRSGHLPGRRRADDHDRVRPHRRRERLRRHRPRPWLVSLRPGQSRSTEEWSTATSAA